MIVSVASRLCAEGMVTFLPQQVGDPRTVVQSLGCLGHTPAARHPASAELRPVCPCCCCCRGGQTRHSAAGLGAAGHGVQNGGQLARGFGADPQMGLSSGAFRPSIPRPCLPRRMWKRKNRAQRPWEKLPHGYARPGALIACAALHGSSCFTAPAPQVYTAYRRHPPHLCTPPCRRPRSGPDGSPGCPAQPSSNPCWRSAGHRAGWRWSGQWWR